MHPSGYHKSEEARERCYACSHPEMLEVTPEDQAVAQVLYDQGFFSTSNKYRMVARVIAPTFEQAVTLSPDVPDWLREDLRRWWRSGIGGHGNRGNWSHPGSGRCDERELTMGQFIAFKKLQNHKWRELIRRT